MFVRIKAKNLLIKKLKTLYKINPPLYNKIYLQNLNNLLINSNKIKILLQLEPRICQYLDLALLLLENLKLNKNLKVN